jgi:hypothetical protein
MLSSATVNYLPHPSLSSQAPGRFMVSLRGQTAGLMTEVTFMSNGANQCIALEGSILECSKFMYEFHLLAIACLCSYAL